LLIFLGMQLGHGVFGSERRSRPAREYVVRDDSGRARSGLGSLVAHLTTVGAKATVELLDVLQPLSFGCTRWNTTASGGHGGSSTGSSTTACICTVEKVLQRVHGRLGSFA
jgi:hypothetical protein